MLPGMSLGKLQKLQQISRRFSHSRWMLRQILGRVPRFQPPRIENVPSNGWITRDANFLLTELRHQAIIKPWLVFAKAVHVRKDSCCRGGNFQQKKDPPLRQGRSPCLRQRNLAASTGLLLIRRSSHHGKWNSQARNMYSCGQWRTADYTTGPSYKVPKIKAYLSPLSMKFGTEFHHAQIVIFWIVTPCSFAQCIHFWGRIVISLEHSFIHQSLYSPLLGPGLFFSFVIFFTQTVGLLGQVISPSQGRYLHIGQYNKRTYRHPRFEWDSKPRYQRSNERRHFMP
jgi:hypothetical protein